MRAGRRGCLGAIHRRVTGDLACVRLSLGRGSGRRGSVGGRFSWDRDPGSTEPLVELLQNPVLALLCLRAWFPTSQRLGGRLHLLGNSFQGWLWRVVSVGGPWYVPGGVGDGLLASDQFAEFFQERPCPPARVQALLLKSPCLSGQLFLECPHSLEVLVGSANLFGGQGGGCLAALFGDQSFQQFELFDGGRWNVETVGLDFPMASIASVIVSAT